MAGDVTFPAQEGMAHYYARRAAEYERVYSKPERQNDLRQLAEILGGAFAGESVLEIACGTGYWTQFIARSARSIFATDYNSEVLDLARGKDFGSCPVTFAQDDAYSMERISQGCTAGFHGFWWSHIPLARTKGFLSTLHSCLPEGAKVVMIDNVYVEGSSTPISRTDPEGNTYQARRLQDGSQHEVLKNFPTEASLRGCLQAHATDVAIRFLQYYWIVEYRVASGSRCGGEGRIVHR